MDGLLVDGRWRGRHGIGRFAAEVLARLPVAGELPRKGRPTDAYDPLRVAYWIRQRQPSAFFTPGFNPPMWSPLKGERAPFVFCVHDLIYAHFPLEATRLKRLYFEEIVRPVGFDAHAVLTVSEHVRSELLAWADWPAEKVVAVGNGVSRAFDEIGPKYEPGFPYLLYVGARKPHKNLPRLFTALSRSRVPDDVRLVLTGEWDRSVERAAQACGIHQRLAYLGDADDARLASAYRGAIALVIPSLEEGFGLPAVEAMACGTPVVAAETGALPEVAGGAALFVEPLDLDSIAHGLERVVEDAALRDRLRRRGLERAARYSWDAVAEKVKAALPLGVGVG